MTQLGAVANDATQVVASQASNFAAAASTGGGNNGVPINVAQVLTTITKLKSAMELVVDVIGELETCIKTAANKNQFLTDSAFHPNGSTTTPNAATAAHAAAPTGSSAAPSASGKVDPLWSQPPALACDSLLAQPPAAGMTAAQ